MIAAPAYVLGGRAPARIAEPADAAETAALLRACDDAGEAVVLHGGGTFSGMGNAPSRYDVAVVMRRLDALHAYDHRDLTVGAGAGMTVASLNRTLAEYSQFVPLDVPFPDVATIGGTLAAGWSGPRRATYGRPRDLVIGTEAALADGTLARAGGMVVKNVTGYDLSKLYAGSFGTLAALTRANFKALPLPAVRRLAIAPISDETRERALAHTLGVAVEPTALLLIDRSFAALPGIGEAPAALVARFEGSAAVVERATREFRSALGAAGVAETTLLDGSDGEAAFQRLLDAYLAPRDAASIVYRGHGLPGDAAARARAAAQAVGALPVAPVPRRDYGIATLADVRGGDVIIAVSANDEGGLAVTLPVVDRAVRTALGRATVIARRGTSHPDVEPWGEPPAAIATMRALKARFDPRGTLAPGRFVGGI